MLYSINYWHYLKWKNGQNTKKKKSVFRPQIMEKKFLYFFKQHITNVFIRTCSWINVWWKSTDLLTTAFMCLGMLSTGLSHCCCMISCNSWGKNSGFSALFDGLWPSIFLLIMFQSFSKVVLVWILGSPWQDRDLVVLHPHLDFPSLRGMHVASSRWKKSNSWRWGSLSTQKTASVLDRFFWTPH